MKTKRVNNKSLIFNICFLPFLKAKQAKKSDSVEMDFKDMRPFLLRYKQLWTSEFRRENIKCTQLLTLTVKAYQNVVERSAISVVYFTSMQS